MNATIVSVICAAVAAAVGVGGYFLGRDKHLAQDAFWRGEVNTKLDMILRILSMLPLLHWVCCW